MAIYTQEDYEELGRSLGLELIGYAPANVFEKAEWVCLRCKRTLHKNRRALVYGKFPCPCYREDALNEEHYRELSSRLKLEWIGEHLPPNNKQETLWRVLGSDFTFGASYHQLSYGNGKRFKDLIKSVQTEVANDEELTRVTSNSNATSLREKTVEEEVSPDKP